jgi:peptidoglycan-N-acetylglucosamine deacetylase
VSWLMPPFIQASLGVHGLAVASLLVPGAWPWALAAVAGNHVALTAAGLWPRSTVLGPNLLRLPETSRARNEVAITIDDGPDPRITPAVLGVLAAHGVRATFFCIAERARENAALTRRIVEAGHSVQNHSHHHRHNFSLMGPRALAREIGDAQAMLADITGVAPHCFRAPAGLRSPLLDPVLHRLGLHLVSWTRRGFDTREREPARVLARLTRGLAAGDILLLHDGHAQRDEEGKPIVLHVLPLLLEALRQQGLKPVTLAAAVPPRGDNRSA